jgi:acyl carrier protein
MMSKEAGISSSAVGVITDSGHVRKVVVAILAKHGRLTVDVQEMRPGESLYDVGLTSLATVSLMLAIESHFDVEFAENMLSRRTFQSVGSIAEAVGKLISADR